MTKVNWKTYGLVQAKNQLPVGPTNLVVHLAGYQIPFNQQLLEKVRTAVEQTKITLRNVDRGGGFRGPGGGCFGGGVQPRW